MPDTVQVTEPASTHASARLESTAAALSLSGHILFSLAIIGLGIETILYARHGGHSLGPRYLVIPAIPWLPAVPAVGYFSGIIWAACGLGLLFGCARRTAALVLGTLLFLCAAALDAPKYAGDLANISMRTIVFEPLGLACLAWLQAGGLPGWLKRVGTTLLALSLAVFGFDHFPALQFVASLIPGWIPWHVFWAAFFGVALIAAGIGIGFGVLNRWAAAGAGLIYGTWVVTLHVPRVLGIYGIPGAPHNPDEWSSLFIAIALWGGLWALTRADAIKSPA